MATDSTIGSILGPNASTPGTSTAAPKKKDQLGRDEFLNLLVTQLKNQDPLDPMKNEEFAVNLAQFSQLEQLISINQKVGSSNGSDATSLASYLGTEVTFANNSVHVENNDGGLIKVDLPQDAASLRIDLVDSAGNVKETLNTGAVKAGKHTIALQNLSTSSGTFSAKVTGIASAGGTFEPSVYGAGIVTGFIPGADPSLIVGGREVKPGELSEVSVPSN